MLQKKEPSIMSNLKGAVDLVGGLTNPELLLDRKNEISKEEKYKKQIENYVKSRQGHAPGRIHVMRDGTTYLVMQDQKRMQENPGVSGYWVKVVNTGTPENPVWVKAPKTSKRAKHRAEVAARKK